MSGPEQRPIRNSVVPALVKMIARAGMPTSDAARFWRIFDLLTRESLNFDPASDFSRFSGICNDGSPWQYCAVVGASNPAPVRFLTEIGAPGTPLVERIRLSQNRIANALREAGYESHNDLLGMLAEAAPQVEGHIAGIWVALAIGPALPAQFRLYANIGWGDTEARWLRLVGLLGEFSAHGLAGQLKRLLPHWHRFAPAGFAVSVPSSPPRIKIYFRASTAPWAEIKSAARAICGAASDELFAGIAVGFGRSVEDLPSKSIVASISGPAHGSPIDVKLDFCGHCIFGAETDVSENINRLAGAFGFDPFPAFNMLEDIGWGSRRCPSESLPFVGVGCRSTGPDRINFYFSPHAPSTASARQNA